MNNAKNKSIEKIESIAKIITCIFGLAFIFGFLIWNTYLYGLGFKEDNIIQTRFIFTGISFLIISTPLILFTIFILNLIKKINKTLIRYSLQYFLLILGFTYYIIFVYAIFTRLPIVLGGGRPRGLSIMAEPNTLSYLEKFGISLADGSTTQTVNTCITYENDKHVIIILDNRVMQINSDEFKGLISLPGISVGLSRNCSEAARQWIKKTIRFEFLSDEKISEQISCEQNLLKK